MAKKKPSIAELEQQLLDANAKNAELRSQVDTQTRAAVAHQERFATAVPGHRAQFAELMVGIRCVSDTTVGVPALFKGDSDLHLHADYGHEDPARCAIISYAWYRELRKGQLFAKGLLTRDDSILGSLYQPAPEDLPGEVAVGHEVNTILDPTEWVNARNEQELRDGIAAITSEDSLRRLRRVVDEYLLKFEGSQVRGTVAEQVKAAKAALMSLPAKLRMLDDLVTQRLEQPLDDATNTGPIRVR